MARIAKVVEAAREAGKHYVGTEVSWRCGFRKHAADAVSIPRAKVVEAFGRFKDFVPNDTVEDLVTKSMRSKGWRKALRLHTNVGVKEMEQHNKDTVCAWGLYFTVCTEGEDGDPDQCGARVRIDPTSGSAVCLPPEGKTDFDQSDGAQDCKKYGEASAEFINERLGSCVNQDLSHALSALVTRLGGVPRHPSGGVYLMPPDERTDEFVAIVEKLEALTEDQPSLNRFFADPTPQFCNPRDVDQGFKTWQRIVQHSFEAEADQLTADLKAMQGRKTRDATWEKRQAECADLLVRADRFATLLADKLVGVKGVLSKLESEYGSAAEAMAELKNRASSAFGGLNTLAEKATAKATNRKQKKAATAEQVPAQPEPAKTADYTPADLDRLFGG